MATSINLRLHRRLILSGWAMVLAASWAVASEPTVREAGRPFRFGVTAAMVEGVNRNDAQASMRVYFGEIAKARGIETAPPMVLEEVEEAGRMLRTGELDALSLTAPQYFQISASSSSSHVFGRKGLDVAGDTLVILVRQDSKVTKLSDLNGGVLLEFESHRTNLRRVWLDLILTDEGLPRTEEFFRTVTAHRKLLSIVPPVFFGKAEACVVHRRGFDLMVELNPQLGKNLRVLAESPPLVSQVMCFGAKVETALRNDILTGMLSMHERVRSQQLLAVFQIDDRIVEFPLSALDSARDLIQRHQARFGKNSIELLLKSSDETRATRP
jgi:ABC-type phosphate/phosphonate transport system substrate-binding protein